MFALGRQQESFIAATLTAPRVNLSHGNTSGRLLLLSQL
jgi:hypothetical protein